VAGGEGFEPPVELPPRLIHTEENSPASDKATIQEMLGRHHWRDAF